MASCRRLAAIIPLRRHHAQAIFRQMTSNSCNIFPILLAARPFVARETLSFLVPSIARRASVPSDLNMNTAVESYSAPPHTHQCTPTPFASHRHHLHEYPCGCNPPSDSSARRTTKPPPAHCLSASGLPTPHSSSASLPNCSRPATPVVALSPYAGVRKHVLRTGHQLGGPSLASYHAEAAATASPPPTTLPRPL